MHSTIDAKRLDNKVTMFLVRSGSPNFGQESCYFQNAKAFLYRNPTRNQGHPQNKHSEDNRTMIGLSPQGVPGGKWCQVKR